MSLKNWIIIYLTDIGFWAWAFYLGGAEFLENTHISGVFSLLTTLKWREMSSEGIKLFGWLILFFHTFFFILGLQAPPVRDFFNII